MKRKFKSSSRGNPGRLEEEVVEAISPIFSKYRKTWMSELRLRARISCGVTNSITWSWKTDWCEKRGYSPANDKAWELAGKAFCKEYKG